MIIIIIITKMYIAHMSDGKINRQIKSEANKKVDITNVKNQSKMLKGKIEIAF